jgi:dihydrofolate reductase
MFAICSVNGFIAREDGSVDRLAQWDPVEAGYGEFFDSYDGLVMGAKTYDQILIKGDWHYGDKPCFILSNQERKPMRDCIEFIAGDTGQLVDLVSERNLKRIRLVGGASIYTQFHRKKLINDYYIAVVPIMLGSGVPLLQTCDKEVGLKLIKSRAFDSGLIINHYRAI